MSAAPGQLDAARTGYGPNIFWWLGYFAFALWAQELTGGLDFLSPAILVCLQLQHRVAAAWMLVLWTLIQEGCGNFVFGVGILFYAGMCIFFFLSRWLLDPEHPVFIILFSLLLAIWSWAVINGAVSFQEYPQALHSPWLGIIRQWAAYTFSWLAILLTGTRWSHRGHV